MFEPLVPGPIFDLMAPPRRPAPAGAPAWPPRKPAKKKGEKAKEPRYYQLVNRRLI